MINFPGSKIIITLLLLVTENLSSQCISTFPNTESFESAALWTTGGTNSDWAWGSPSKAVITGAGSGSKCWIVGGLTASSYNGGQQSFIKSPCYNFSSLSCPVVSFKVFWEMEFKYDGAGLQYSTDNGVSWTSVGSYSDPTNCMTSNWYNHNSINYLSSNSKQGWSGNSKSTSGSCQGGSGSLGWVNAKHCLANLAGLSNVQFRFVFGSGTSCNSFDGFAIDDFTIENAVVGATGFTNTCVNFTGIDTSCQKASSYLWNFGDPSSGASNTSTILNTTHPFSSPGVYTVSLISFGGACSASNTVSKVVSVLGSSITSISNVNCKGGTNGSAVVSPLSGNGNYSYTWSPEGGNTATASALSAGNYSVLITDANGCQSTSTVNIAEPNPNTGPSSQTLNACSGDITELKVILSGILDPVSYLWSAGSATNSSVYVSPSSTTIYSVSISTSGTCSINQQKLFTVEVSPKPQAAINLLSFKGCAPFSPLLKDESIVSQGNIVKREWSFSNGVTSSQQTPEISFTSPGIYSGNLKVTNSFGCTATLNQPATFTILSSPTAEYTSSKFKVGESETINFTNLSSADAMKWEWNFGGLAISHNPNPDFSFNSAGEYPVVLTVTDKEGCSNTIVHTIEVIPEFTFYMPNAFTPNADNLNDTFLPKGTGWDVSQYEFQIFDRWGQKLFYTNKVNEGWSGQQNQEAIYVWKVELTDINKKQHSFMGTVLLYR